MTDILPFSEVNEMKGEIEIILGDRLNGPSLVLLLPLLLPMVPCVSGIWTSLICLCLVIFRLELISSNGGGAQKFDAHI